MKSAFHTPKDRKEIYHRFISYVEEWRVRLAIREWEITIRLEEDDFKQDSCSSGAFTEARPKYHEALITLHLPDGAEWTNAELEETAIHELMHVLVSTWFAVWERTHEEPISPSIHNMLLITEEQLCSRLALGFKRTRYPRRKA